MKEDFVKLSDIDMVKFFCREEGQKMRQVLRDTFFAQKISLLLAMKVFGSIPSETD